ncbi:whisker protein [Pectobacterium phage POP12]|nr:whisker protein [Pectobacterium phage POP12]
MIEKLELPKIPYVDGIPDENQESITWIRNGVNLDGAKTKVDNGGNLNKASTEIQQNIVALEDNQFSQLNKVNELVDNVNVIANNLPAVSDGNIFTKVDKAVTDIEELTLDLQTTANQSGELQALYEALMLDVGVWNPTTDPKHRTIRKDIIYLKTELGAYPGSNTDGDPVIGAPGSGLKYRVITNAIATANQEQRLTNLEDRWILSDVGRLTTQVEDLRSEMGNSNQKTQESVYTRLTSIKTLLDTVKTKTDNLVAYTGYADEYTQTITQLITALTTRIDNLEEILNEDEGLIFRVDSIQQQIGSPFVSGSIRFDIADIRQEQTDMSLLIGQSSMDGIRGQINQINTELGANNDQSSLKGRVTQVETLSRENNLRLTDVENTVGNSGSGLVASNTLLGKSVYGDGAAETKFDQDGLVVTLKAVVDELGKSDLGSETGIYKLISELADRISVLENK